MARTCTVCAHKKRAQIEADLLAPDATFRKMAGRWKLSSTALHHHKKNHINQAAIVARAEAEQEKRGQSLADFWQDLKQRFERIAASAKREGDRRAETAATRELTRLMDLAVRAASELQSKGTHAQLHEHPDFAAFVAVLCDTLTDYPDALDAVRIAITESVAA